MAQLPSLELLEATHKFPETYVFKAIGRRDPKFVARVVAAVREELNAEQDPPYRTRDSGSDNHVAVTVEPVVQNASDVHRIYNRLLTVPGLLLLL